MCRQRLAGIKQMRTPEKWQMEACCWLSPGIHRDCRVIWNVLSILQSPWILGDTRTFPRNLVSEGPREDQGLSVHQGWPCMQKSALQSRCQLRTLSWILISLLSLGSFWHSTFMQISVSSLKPRSLSCSKRHHFSSKDRVHDGSLCPLF